MEAIAFTGGIGKNVRAVREAILKRLGFAGVTEENMHVIAAREERRIAREALSLMREHDPQSQ